MALYYMDRQKIVNELDDSVADRRLSEQRLGSFEDYLGCKNQNSIFMENKTPFDISEIVKVFHNGKASDIPISIIKKI